MPPEGGHQEIWWGRHDGAASVHLLKRGTMEMQYEGSVSAFCVCGGDRRIGQQGAFGGSCATRSVESAHQDQW